MNHEKVIKIIGQHTSNKDVLEFYKSKLAGIDLKSKRFSFDKFDDVINGCLVLVEYINRSNEELVRDGMMTYEGGMELIFTYTLDTLIFHVLEEQVHDKKVMMDLYSVFNKYTMLHCLNDNFKNSEFYDELNKVLV